MSQGLDTRWFGTVPQIQDTSLWRYGRSSLGRWILETGAGPLPAPAGCFTLCSQVPLASVSANELNRACEDVAKPVLVAGALRCAPHSTPFMTKAAQRCREATAILLDLDALGDHVLPVRELMEGSRYVERLRELQIRRNDNRSSLDLGLTTWVRAHPPHAACRDMKARISHGGMSNPSWGAAKG